MRDAIESDDLLSTALHDTDISVDDDAGCDNLADKTVVLLLDR